MPTRQGSRGVFADGSHQAQRPSPAETFLLRVIDYALATVLCGLPFLMGGRCALGQWVLALIGAVSALALAGLLLVRPTGGKWPAAGFGILATGVVLLIVQLTPWPQSVLDRIAPHLKELLPLWKGGAAERLGLERWATVSVSPAETRGALVVFLSYAILFATTTVRIRRVEHIERILRWCALAAMLMAVFGVVQYIFANGRFFWIYAHPFSNTADAVKGSFTNRNHFAGFLALGIGPLVWWLASLDCPAKQRRAPSAAPYAIPTDPNTWLRALMLGIVGMAAMISLSRGGLIATVLASGVATTLLLRTYAAARNLLFGLAAVGVVTVAAWTAFGGPALDARLETVASGSLEDLDPESGRRCVWSGVLQGIPKFLPFGSGAGSFRQAAPLFVRDARGDVLEYTHAENSYLQITLEAGLIGLLLIVAGMALTGAWCVRGFLQSDSVRTKACVSAVAASLAAFAMHGVTDFLWYVPACAATISVLAACAWSAATLHVKPAAVSVESTRRPAIPRWALGGGLVAATCLGSWMVVDRWRPLFSEPALEEHQRLSLQTSGDGKSAKPIEDALHRIAVLDRAVKWDSKSALAHSVLAEEHLAAFDAIQAGSANAMTLRNIRDAAVRAKFSSAEALGAWLARAVGQNRVHLGEALHHAREAVRLAPLEGRAYACLAQVAFLESPSNPDGKALFEQALIVRPHEGAILYAAANEAALHGNQARWVELTQRTILCGTTWQARVIVDMIAAVPRESVCQVAGEFIDLFHPDLDGLRLLSRLCRQAAAPCEVPSLDRLYGEAAARCAAQRDGLQAAMLWLEAETCYSRLGEGTIALKCVRRACFASPENFDVRRRLALALVAQEAWEEAEEHLRWCAERRPSDSTIQSKFREALGQRIARRSALRDTRLFLR